jgi:hypothetical protein
MSAEGKLLRRYYNIRGATAFQQNMVLLEMVIVPSAHNTVAGIPVKHVLRGILLVEAW